MNELEGCSELMGMSAGDLAVSSCVTPHAFGLCGRPNVTPAPVQQPTGDTPHMLLNSINRSAFPCLCIVTLPTLILSNARRGISFKVYRKYL